MNTIIFALSITIVAGALGACAPVQLARSDVDGRIVCNSDRMDQVERAARRENREVHWINCPLATLRVAS
ncbi:MAG TPA: hypothetical protein VLN42_07210 [Casimicrobiaceae bacterium]|nr:hypothetical protein [Casimicrobiaceae bacterium]